ncbi:hypothetical protein [Candidatus Methylocalor cossyra]|uniref:Lipoprotein n=1 Tax=Candidatus Methylocalor cossyra TaxID=3108543 RepID=A0ABM9NGN3_9GAMM
MTRAILLIAIPYLSGCATPGLGQIDRPADFPISRLSYAILTEDRDTLRREYRLNPDRSWVERALAGFTLPFTAATETAFWPLYYGFSRDFAQ